MLDLVPQSTVKVDDVTVGMVEDDRARRLHRPGHADAPRGRQAARQRGGEIRQTSLLGEKFVSLDAAGRATRAPSTLGDGDVIPLERTGRNTEVEEVLGALSLVLNGGGVAQLKTITQELTKAFEGREGTVKSVLTRSAMLHEPAGRQQGRDRRGRWSRSTRWRSR